MIRLHRTANERGDTLVEVAMALAIISAVAASTFLTANLASKSGQATNQRNDAVALEEQQAEILRNIRDNAVVTGGANGWASFRTTVFGPSGITPLCSSGTGIPVHISLPAGTGTNVWTYDAATGTNAIKTATNTFAVGVRACYPDVGVTSIVFTIDASWPDGNQNDTSSLSTTLANVNDINQIAPSF